VVVAVVRVHGVVKGDGLAPMALASLASLSTGVRWQP
jgi:hypothetical protein